MYKQAIIISIILTIVTIVVLVLGVNMLGVGERIRREDKNIENYRKYSVLNVSEKIFLKEELVIFPQKITQEMTVNNYSNITISNRTKVVGRQIYLDITYTEQAYQAEIERLSMWKKVLNKSSNKQVEVKFKYDNGEYFDMPAYIAAYNEGLLNEHAILYGENSIAYVFLTRILENETTLPKQFVAKGYYDLAARFERGEIGAAGINSYGVYLGSGMEESKTT